MKLYILTFLAVLSVAQACSDCYKDKQQQSAAPQYKRSPSPSPKPPPPKPECLVDADCVSSDGCFIPKCQGGACTTVPLVCPVDLCAPTVCVNGACVVEEEKVVKCNMSNLCKPEVCEEGVCVMKEVDCDDGNPCTLNGCLVVNGVPTCQNPVDISLCDDKSLCTQDTCVPSSATEYECKYTPKVCDDKDLCTFDTCSATTGECVYTPKVCDDKDLCTFDTCNATTGECVYTPKVCDDKDKCTMDICNPKTGDCIYQNICTKPEPEGKHYPPPPKKYGYSNGSHGYSYDKKKATYNPNDYNPKGYDPKGYDPKGYDPKGYNAKGNDRKGYYDYPYLSELDFDVNISG